MNIFKKLFGGVKSLVEKIVALVKRHVSEYDLDLALHFVREAATKYVDNTQRREWAVSQLMRRGIPESIARLAVELAVQLIKKELD